MSDTIKKTKVKEEVNVTLYPIKDLINNCEVLTGHKKHVVVGALFNCNKEEMSKDDFKNIVEKFLKRRV